MKVNNRNTRKRCEKCTKLTIKTLFKNKKKHVRLPVQFTKLLRTPILKNSCVQLLVMRLLSYTRSSHRRCSVKTSVLRNLANFTSKHQCWSLVFHKVAGLQACNFLKKRLQHLCLRVKFAKLLRTSTLNNICVRLILTYQFHIFGKHVFYN